MALLGKGKSILSCLQMEAYGADINDRPRSLPGGKQRILIDGYQIPLDFKNGLAYLRCRKPTAAELGLLPTVLMTSDVDWDPSIYDTTIENLAEFYDPTLDVVDHDNPFDDYGESLHRKVVTDSPTKHHKVIYRSEIRSALDPEKRNQHLSPFGGETASNCLGDKMNSNKNDTSLLDDGDPIVERRMVTIDRSNL
jgi:hypothetical protein